MCLRWSICPLHIHHNHTVPHSVQTARKTNRSVNKAHRRAKRGQQTQPVQQHYGQIPRQRGLL